MKLIVTRELKLSSVNSIRHGVNKAEIEEFLSALENPSWTEGRNIRLCDSIDSMALSRWLWTAIRPEYDPIFSPRELEQALVNVVADIMYVQNSATELGVPASAVDHTLRRLKSDLKVDALPALKALFLTDTLRVKQVVVLIFLV